MCLTLILISLRSCFSLIPRGAIARGLFSKSFLKFGLKMLSYTGFSGFDLIFSMYCIASLSLLRFSGISLASTCKLVTGEVRKALRHVLRAWFCTRSRDLRYDGRADP